MTVGSIKKYIYLWLYSNLRRGGNSSEMCLQSGNVQSLTMALYANVYIYLKFIQIILI